ncbi:MAG: hypothetical protein ILM98_14450 [Kiritimatiellae bacterium]|nr:hypothetical protein [Kiritimatiellia bacterium]
MKNNAFTILAACATITTATAATTPFGNRSRDFAEWCAEKYTAGDTILINADGTLSTWLDGLTSQPATVDVTQISIIPQYGNRTDLEFIVRNGACLNVGTFVVNAKNGLEEKETAFTATNGAVVNVSGDTRIFQNDGIGGVFTANFDHATLTNDGAVAIGYRGKACYLDWGMTNSEWTLNGALNVGVNTETDSGVQGTYDLAFDFADSNVRFGSSAGNPSIFRAQIHATNTSFVAESAKTVNVNRGATLTLDDCALTNLLFQVGFQDDSGAGVIPAEVRLNGGRHLLSGIWNGRWSATDGRLIVDRGADVVYAMPDGNAFKLGWQGTGTVEVAGGTLRVRAGDAQSVRAGACGNGTTGEGFIRVTGGTWINTNNVNRSEVYLGESGGAGHFEMTAGAHYGTGFVIGASGSEKTSTFRQSGGLIDICARVSNANNEIVLANQSPIRGEMTLTGGELRAKRIRGGAGTSTFYANGGTVKPKASLTDANGFLYSITSATLGPRGLTLDTDSFDVPVTQDLADATGESGLLRKSGLGTLTYSAASYDVANTVVDGGTMELGNAAISFETGLTVTNGATFSFGSVPSVALSSLVVSNATLVVDPAVTTVTVSGPVALGGLRIQFTTVPTLDQLEDFLVIDGELDFNTKRALRQAVFENAFADGTHGALEATYDQGTGKTTIKAGVKTNAPLGTTVWTGSGAWGTDANWDNGAPTADTLASFTGSPAGTSVALGSDATAGALSFAGNEYTLSGGQLYLAGEAGQAGIASAADSTNTINSAVVADVVVPVQTDGPLALNGPVSGVGIEKTGLSTLTLGAANDFSASVTVTEGVLESAVTGALAANEVRQLGGVVKFTAPETLGTTYRVTTSAATDFATIRTESDVVLPDFDLVQGKLIKRGVGRLEIPFDNSDSPQFCTSGPYPNPRNSHAVGIPDDGAAPYDVTDGSAFDLGGLTVAEGELVLSGTTSNTTVSCPGPRIIVGLMTTNCVAQPKLQFKDIDLGFDYNANLYVGVGANEDASRPAVDEPTFAMDNASASFDYVIIGLWCYGRYSHPTVALTNSVLISGRSLKLSQANGFNKGSSVRWFVKDSKITCGNTSTGGSGFTWYGGLELDFDHSTMERKDGTCAPFTGMQANYTYGTMAFRNGSVFGVNTIDASGITHDCTVSFDDSTWRTDANLALSSANASPTYFHVRSVGSGLKVNAAEGTTFSFSEIPLTGDGGVVSMGAGTLSFGAGMFQTTGAIRAESGVIDFSNAGTVSGATVEAGAGTISGANFSGATVSLDSWNETTVPIFNGCTFDGRTTVAIAGERPENGPNNVLVARYTGTAPSVARWRLAGGGGAFTASDGEIRVSANQGFHIIIQ